MTDGGGRRAAVYVRVSTEEQARGGVSLDMQGKHCRQRAEADGAEAVEVYRDDGYSGTTTRRPALQALLRDLPDIDTIYVWKLDRLSRSVRDTANLLHDLSEANVGLVSATENFDYGSPAGRAMLQMVAVFAEMFVGILRENVRAAQAQIADNGRSPNKPPFGYDVPRDAQGNSLKGAWRVVEDEAAEVRAAFQAYADGASLQEIADDWNLRDLGHRQTGSMWRGGHLGKILRNPAYIGQFRFRDNVFEGQHEPIVPDALWRSVQARLRRRATTNPRLRDRSLTGIFVCGVCGGPIRRTGRRDGYHYYICGRRKETPAAKRHEEVGEGAEKVDAVVWAWIRRAVKTNAIREGFQRALSEAAKDGEAEEVVRELRELEARIDRNLEAFHAGALPVDMLKEKNEALVQKRGRLQARRDRRTDVDARVVEQVMQFADTTIERVIESGDLDRQQAVLQAVLTKVRVNADSTITIVPRWAEKGETFRLPKYYAPNRGKKYAKIDLDDLYVS